jgi:DHA2 family multidrug resistance protein
MSTTAKKGVKQEARTGIVLAVRQALADPHDALAGIGPILARAGCDERNVELAFDDADALIVAIAEHQAGLLSQPLTAEARLSTVVDTRDILVAFGCLAWQEYATTLVGFVRMMIAEGTRNPQLKERVYEAGPASVTSSLRGFLSEASKSGILSISDAQLAAEYLMGMLREPLYQALMLNRLPNDEPAAERVEASVARFIDGCAITGSLSW